MMFLAVITLGLIANPAKAAMIWLWDGTELTGASNVDVGGTLYDVTFEDGTCIEVFSGCNDAAEDFAFTTSANAQLAAQALLDQVFLDPNSSGGGAPDHFDSIPDKTLGCTLST